MTQNPEPQAKKHFKDMPKKDQAATVIAVLIPVITGVIHVVAHQSTGGGEFPAQSLALLGSIFAALVAGMRFRAQFFPDEKSKTLEHAANALAAGLAGYVLIVAFFTTIL